MKNITHSNSSGGRVLAFHEFKNILQGFIWVLPLEPLLAQFLHCLLKLWKCDGSGILGPGESDRNPGTLNMNSFPYSELASFVLSPNVLGQRTAWASPLPYPTRCLVSPAQMLGHMKTSWPTALLLLLSHPNLCLLTSLY